MEMFFTLKWELFRLVLPYTILAGSIKFNLKPLNIYQEDLAWKFELKVLKWKKVRGVILFAIIDDKILSVGVNSYYGQNKMKK